MAAVSRRRGVARPQGLKPPAEIIRLASIRSCGGIGGRGGGIGGRGIRGPVRAAGVRTVPGRVRRARVTRLS